MEGSLSRHFPRSGMYLLIVDGQGWGVVLVQTTSGKEEKVAEESGNQCPSD